MTESTQYRHYATYRGEELVVCGHNTGQNNCMVVRLAALPNKDAERLRAIASSRIAQTQTMNLTTILTKESYDGQIDWFTYLAHQVPRRGGPVFMIPLKDIQDTLEPSQRADYKGYGKKAFAKTAKSVVDSEQISADVGFEHRPLSVIDRPADNSELRGQIENLSTYVVDEMGENRRVLGSILQVLERAFPVPAQVPAAEAAEAKPKARKK